VREREKGKEIKEGKEGRKEEFEKRGKIEG
jgi:hypothetical protein